MSEEEPTALASAKAEIASSLPTVRAHFFDLEGHVRDALYHDVELSFSPQHPPEARRLRIVTRVLGRTLVDDLAVDEGPGGEWIRRYVEGPNAGSRFVANFREGDAERTFVRLEAFVPKSGFTAGIAKVSRIGMEKILERTLGVHQRVIEAAAGKAGSTPKEVSAQEAQSMRTLGAHLAALQPEARVQAIQTLLEVACVTAIADGRVDADERGAVHRVFRELCGIELSPAAMDELLESAAEVVASDGVEARCDLSGRALRTLGLVELGLDVAVTVALVSHSIDRHELCAIGALAVAAGEGEEAVDRAVARGGRPA
jgi:uncharacterized tellurite resistance protein B-like protein